MRPHRLLVSSLLLFAALPCPAAEDAKAPPAPKKIVLIAGPKSHGPVGNGIHDYPWSVKLLKVMLDNSNVADRVRVEYHLDGWPADPATLDDADAILVVSDGRDGDAYAEAPHFASDDHLRAIEKQIRRGCGFLTFHFSTFAPDKYADQILDWSGGYFDWETDGKRQWYSKIETRDAEVRPASPNHPISRGLAPFRMNEEFYFDIRFRPNDARLTPIAVVPDLPGREPDGRIVAWAREREDGGRGFGTTCGHFYENWKNDAFRRMILNALVWAAKADVPEGGVTARFYSHEEITAALAGTRQDGRAALDDAPIKALILTGAQHPAHLWRDTTPAIKDALERDPRMRIDVSENVEDLATEKIRGYDLLVLNYCNWERPGLSEAAKSGFVRYLAEGGGLCIVHFANGAFHFSLPGTGDSDWPEYRKICRRVWDHTAGKSGHDAYGPFTVEIENADHPVTRGLEPFRTTDELYFSQQGDEPIEVLAKAFSNVTNRWEPMAFVYEYGKGRVMQTVLGHSVESIRNPGTAAILRRAAAWVAKRDPAADPLPKADDNRPVSHSRLAEGKFGIALDARGGGLFVPGREEYRLPPLTVECWAKVEDRTPFNILVAQEPKSSATHWELFGMAGSGHLTAYLPGMTPDHVRSDADLCDGRWHHVAMIYEPRRVRLVFDGETVADQIIEPKGADTVTGPLAFGTLATNELGCAGLIDEVRISRGIREIKGLPDRPQEADDLTLGLWRFDSADDAGTVKDESSLKADAKPEPPETPAPATSKIEGHWGEEAVGVRWTETDSIDSRWDKTQVGPFLASILPLPDRKPVQKGLSVRVGENGEAAVCYDTATGTMRAAWTGGFLKFDPARYGLIAPPRPAGSLVFTTDDRAGWNGETPEYRSLRLHGDRIVLSYDLGGVEIRESPWSETRDGVTAITRTIEVGPSLMPLALDLLDGTAKVVEMSGRKVAVAEQGDRTVAVAVVGLRDVFPEARDGSRVAVTVPAGEKVRRLKLVTWTGTLDKLFQFAKSLDAGPAPEDLAPLAAPGPPRWTARIETRGAIGRDDGPYAVDTLTLPFDNPYSALLFVSGHDFLPNGDIALSTAHGDVWVVSGVDAALDRLVWKRFATGLFQPIGLKVVDGVIHVLGRDQITRLRDENGDGEADSYECFSNLHETSPNGHDYVAGLETDLQGNFYFIHATQGLVRVSKDGKKLDVVATGFRNPIGLSVGPDGTMTAAPQEGEWTPGSCVIQVREGGHYGYLGPKVTPDRPLGYDLPVCWIPRRQDNSSGGQVWVTSDRWGPFEGQLLHLSYGQCRMILVLREDVEGQVQGGVVDFPFDFESGVMRGRFSPHDGQLYVSGLKGWVSAAVKDGCLQRVRYTGKPVDFPVAARTMRNGIALTFTRPLDRSAAENAGSYRVEQWNYSYGAHYGSPELRPSAPQQEGRDEVNVASATLLDDGRTVFLEMPDLVPVNQMAIRYAIVAADGTPIRQTLAYTIHRLGPEAMEPSKLHRPTPLADQPDEAVMRTGIAVRFEQGGRTDARSQRLVALHAAEGSAPTPLLAPGPFTATFEGWVQIPLRGEYALSAEGAGAVRLAVNGRDVLAGDLPARSATLVPLEKGYNRLSLRYESPSQAGASLRLLWSSDDFPEEPIPPTALFHSVEVPGLAEAGLLRRGRELFASHQCSRCHGGDDLDAASATAESVRKAPDLRDAGRRLSRAWVASWLLDPRAYRHDATMPRLFDPNDGQSRKSAADIAAYLATLGGPGRPGDPLTTNEGSAEQGKALFADLGCIACHRLTAPGEPDDYARLSLSHVAAKYLGGELISFLRRPHERHVGSRMPDFGLSDAEASALAAYLRHKAADSSTAKGNGDPNRGRELFGSLRCAKCHESPEVTRPSPALASVAAAVADRGCLAEATRPGVPDFGFTPADRAALAAFLKSKAPEIADTPEEASARLFASLRCAACHDRDADRSPRRSIVAEETDSGFAPETLPSLTWTGEKLNFDWTQRLLAGRVTEKSRPQLKARMPAFPEYAELLAEGFAAEHGIERGGERDEPIDPQLAEVGRKLAATATGLDCRQCHGVGDEKPLGDARTIIAPGINFSLTRDRLRHDYYTRFVLDPPRYEVETKMPKLAPDGRTSKIRDFYDGDARRQFEAIWHYIGSSPPISTASPRQVSSGPERQPE